MKKILISLIALILLCGCEVEKSSNEDVERNEYDHNQDYNWRIINKEQIEEIINAEVPKRKVGRPKKNKEEVENEEIKENEQEN